MMQPTIKMKGSGAVTDADKPEVDRNMALLDEALIRLAPMISAQLLVEHVEQVLSTLDQHERLLTGKGRVP